LSTIRAHPSFHSLRTKGLLGSICLFGIGAALAMSSSPAAAQSRLNDKAAQKSKAEHISKQPFGDIPKGPLQIFISISQQKLFLYSDGTLVADASVATGVPGHLTPMGVFSVIQKQRFHRSNIYSNAPMPFMQRITWSGVAMHEGPGVGHPASHGCIRMPDGFAERLYGVTPLGTPVIIARNALKPVLFADAHLFAHKDAPLLSAAAAAETEQGIDKMKTTDAIPALATVPSAKSATPAAAAAETGTNGLSAGEATAPASGGASSEEPLPPPKLARPLDAAAASHRPIAIFISRKTQRVYVRQNFMPLFDAPVTIKDPAQPLGTHVFTAIDYLNNGADFRWNLVSLPGETSNTVHKLDQDPKSRITPLIREHDAQELKVSQPRPPETPQQALARIEISQDVIDQISRLIIPGSSLIVSDEGLGEETGEGTNFIVVAR